MVFSAAMRRRDPEKEEEACGVWLDAAALKRRKAQVSCCGGERVVREGLGAQRCVKRGFWVNLEMMEVESRGENGHIWQLRGERGWSLKKAEEWDLGRVERRKRGRKADRQAEWGGM